MEAVLEVEKRTNTGKNANNRTRAAGRIPAVVYGSQKAGDPVALAVGILDVLADEKRRRRMGQLGQERVRRHFTFDAQAEQYVALLKELIEDGEREGVTTRSLASTT